jgi:hypothetical protein
MVTGKLTATATSAIKHCQNNCGFKTKDGISGQLHNGALHGVLQNWGICTIFEQINSIVLHC